MKLEKLKKTNKAGIYEIYIDEKKYKIHEETVLKYNLIKDKEIDDIYLKDIINDNDIFFLIDKVYNYLSRGLKSEKEVRDYLIKQGASNKTISDIVNKLISERLIDDKIYAESYLSDKIRFTSDGPFKIRRNLINKGIEEEVIDEALNSYTRDIEEERIEAILKDRLKSNNKSLYMFKYYNKNYLFNLGYTTEVISKVITSFYFDDSEIKEKLLEKLNQKYKDHENKELLVKKKLYEMGFR